MKLSKKLDRLTPSAVTEILEAASRASANDDNGPLHKVVSDAEANILKATQERDSNTDYVAAKEDVAAFNGGLKDVRDVQKARSALAFALMNESKLSDEDSAALEKARKQAKKSA